MKNITKILLAITFFLISFEEIEAQVQSCNAMPEPVSYTQVGTPTNKKVTEFTTIRGVRVERVLEAGNRSIDNIQYATDDNTPDETYCGKDRKTTFKGGNKKYPFMDSNKVSKITYKFSKPVNDIEVFLAAFGYNGEREWWKQNKPHKDVVKFTVNNGEINLALRSSCTAGAVTISGAEVSSEDKKTTDAKVGISSSAPFTELTLEFLEPSGQTGGYGFFVEICLASIVTPIESSSCTPPTIGDPFNSFPNQTVSVAGMTVTRKADSGVNKSVSFPGSHCGSTKTYPSKDPLLKDSKKIVYEFSTPVKSAEIFLLAFGDNTQVNSFDKAKFEVNGGGAISLSKSYDCNPIVSTINNNVVESVSNRKLTTDVGIKVTSSKPFSKITITDVGSTGLGYLVALCPTSIVKATDDDIFTIDKTLTAQSVCEDTMTGVPPSYEAQATSKFNGGSFKYELQAKKSGSSSWLTIATQDNKTSGTNINFVEANLGTLPYDQANIRVKYTYKNPSEFSEEIVRYSNVATLTVSEAKVTKLTATPLSITQGITTNVAYRIEGTSNATVTYQVNGGTPQTVGLNNSGVATVTLPTSQATTFKITRVQKGACNITQNKQVQVTAAFNNAVCTTKPNSLFATTNDATYTINNITVTRSYVGGTTPNNFLTSSLNDPTEYCSVYPANSNYPWLQKANNRITSVTYKFSQPVNNVEVWLLIMGKGAVGTVDKAKFSINAGCGNPTLSLVADCKGTATINGTTVSENNLIGTDLAVKVTATKPFTELTITDDNSTAGGFLVELCPASIKKQGTGNTDAVTITTQLTATTTACVGFTTTLTTQATLASPFSGSLSYQWQKSTNNGTTWSDISGQSGSATSGANVTYSFTPTTSDNNALYRVAYTYTHAGSFCGTMSLTTNATKLVANAVSSVITVNAPAYTDVAVCASATGTTTITAKATVNAGMGGSKVTYQLQYRPTATGTWVDRATQKHTLVAGGAERILTIENVASNTGYYRVKYTSDASVCGGGESYSNIFKFTALTVTDVLTINPTTYPDKVVCTDASFTINAQATVATGTIANDGSGNKFAYELQYKADNSANWVTYVLPNGGAAQIYSNNRKVGATRVFTINTANVANGGKFRVRYAVDLIGLCDDISAYSGEFTVTKASVLNNITEFYATPATLNETGATNVVYTIKGVPGTQLLHKFNNGTATAASIPPGGVLTISKPGQTATATLAITQVANGTCTLTTNYLVEVGKAGGACTSFPSPQFAKTATAAAQIGGLTVNRTITGTPQFFDAYTYDSGQMCQSTILAGYPIMKGGQATIKYTFSKPVTSVQVWLSGFGGNPSVANADSVTFAVNCGGTVAVNAVGCGTDAGKLTVVGGKVSHQANVYTQAKVVVTSDKPFTELTLTDPDNSSAGGYVVELCPTSIASTTLSVTTNPVPQTVCKGETVTLTAVASVRNTNYQWQQQVGGGAWTNIGSAVATNNGTATLTLNTNNSPYNQTASYRVVFTITCGNTITSTVAVITVHTAAAMPTVSSTTTLCPTANSNIVSFDNYVTPAVGTTLRWYATPTATASTTVAPTINTNVTTRTTTTAYVRAINNNGCTSGLVTVTLTVNDTTPPTFDAPSALNILCNSTTATTAINTWLGTATATDACGAIATITNNYNAPADFCTVPGGVITVTFVAKDTFGNVTTKTSTIKLAATPLTVASDTFTVGNGVTTQTAGNILTNDNLGGNTPTAGPTGSVTITVVTPATPIGGGKTPTLDVNTGIVTVPAGTKSGTYTITYKECESLNPSSNCQTQTVVISVGSASLTVVPETLTVTPSTSTQTTPSIFDNDSIGGVTTPTAGPGGNVTMTVHNPSGSKVPTMDPNTGKVTVPGNTPAGNYTITYNYCEVLNPTNCTGTRTVVVTVGAATLTVASDTFTVGNGVTTQTAGNILTNDNLGGNTPTAGPTGSVTITVVTPATPIGGGKTPTLDVNTGIVTVPAGTKSGTYTITYKECESLNPSSNCQTQTVVISVGSASLTVVPETLTVTPSTSTQTTPSIFDNDSIGGVTTPTAGPGGNVTMTVHNPSGSKVPTMDPNTGKVTVPGNTPAGNYTITYNYCEVLNPTNCTGTRTVVVTVGAATLTVASDTFTVGNGVTTQTAGNILTNDNLGGNTPTAGPTGSVTITVVTPATPIGGGKTPTLDVNTGIVTVPAGTKSGTYTITYKECESLNPSSNCQTQTVVISVGSASLTVVPETLTVTPSTSTQTTPSIFDNDSIGGVTTPTAGPGGNVTMTVHNPSGSKVPTMDPNTGKVTVPGNTPAGNYTITYNYCEVLNPTNCTGTRTVVVTVGAATLTVASDTFTVGNGVTTQTAGNILTNDNLGGNTPTAGPTGSVTITVVTPATPIGGGKTPTLDVNTGIVTVPAGTKSGTYTITYKECESLNPSSNCQTQTVVISVGSASLTVVPETLTVTPSTSTQTTPSIFDNDSIGGVTTPTAGPGGNVTMTVHNPSGSKVPTMDPNTGKVTVPGNTPAGNYTITYNYCEVLNPTNCTGTRTVVVTVGAATLTVASDTFTVGNGVTTQTAGNILTNDNLGGNTPTAGPTGSVTITVVTPATPIGGGKTPTLDVNTGIVTVPAGTKSGTYTITYKECESLNPSSNCQTQTVVISVGSASLTVVPETLTVTPSTSTQTTPSIFDNDSIGGVTTPTAGPGGNVTMTVHNPSGSKVPTMDPNTGKVTVPGNTPAGNYTITYNYCEVLNPTNCTGTRTVVVTVGAPELVVPSKVYPLAPGTTSTETVIDTATLGGNPVSSTAVTIAVVTPATSLGGTPTPTLNTTTGKITVPTGTKSGTYNIVYRVCEVLNPSNCKTATATVVVGEVPVITPDNLPIVPSTPTSTTTRTIGNILTNDTVGTQSATAGTGGNVTITITSPITPNTPVIDPTTGNVQIPPTTPPGVYTITYDVCTTATPVACTSGTLTVTVSQPSPIIRPENLTVTQTGTSTTPSILNNDDIVKPDGTTTSATGSNVTITNVVVTPGAAPGAPTPTLNPDGTITVPGTLLPGVYTITYDVCTTATPSTCVSGTTVLTVSPTATATPTAGDNTYDVPTSGTATVVGTILSNDTVDGVASATATNVTVSVTTAPTGTGVPTIGSNGSVTVPANAIPGVYTYTYHICSVATPTACSTEATVTVTVRQPVPILPNNNMVYTDTTTTTAGNITTGGTVGTQSVTTGPTGNVTITVVTPATPQVPGGTVPTLNPDGTVTVPTGTASGTYTITYQVCTTATPTSCVTGVVTITVSPTTVTPTVLPVAVDDRVSTALNTPVNIAVLANDTLNGATTPNVVTQPANGTVVVNVDNTVEYRPHTGFVGTDTFVYEICNSAGCSSATVTVDIVNKLIPYNGMSVNGDGKNDHFHIGGIENYPNNVVRIYNRWGVKVFEVSGYDNVTRVFRGISDARATVEAADKLPQGTYYYVIEYYDQNNNKQSEVGWLYIKK
ncbi:gliding motility-associated C-terminal domain-containing protein [Capnocytophaga sp. oral taxon 323]|uniref:T9SS type B sorting domain-containing protein n=1 Tax=Capnocytophaga sp. oral taxon 323 TaxID=1705617 RepID=UPI0012FAFE17|nr:gliding motility-associated C-terminal domain-containing protein [Capnocytophaga sp. oral taxon 323]